MRMENISKNKARAIGKKRGAAVPDADSEILSAILALRGELSLMQRNLDYVTDELLIDSYIYGIKAVNIKYQYYLRLCKERGLAAKMS